MLFFLFFGHACKTNTSVLFLTSGERNAERTTSSCEFFCYFKGEPCYLVKQKGLRVGPLDKHTFPEKTRTQLHFNLLEEASATSSWTVQVGRIELFQFRPALRIMRCTWNPVGLSDNGAFDSHVSPPHTHPLPHPLQSAVQSEHCLSRAWMSLPISVVLPRSWPAGF